LPDRKISIEDVGILIIETNRFEAIHYQLAGTKKSRLVGGETVLGADLHGQILNPQNIDPASQMRTMDIECRLIRSDNRVITIEFFGFPNFRVVRAAEDDAWSDAVVRTLECGL
jgi:hypothetical protein